MESKEHSYEFTTEQRKNLDPEEQHTFIRAFKNYDKNKDGKMDESEFKNIMIDIGMRKITDDDVKSMLGDHDNDKDGVISWCEFVDMMNAFKGKDPTKFGVISSTGKAMIETKTGGRHQYAVEEVQTFSKMTNFLLANDEDSKCRVPISIEDHEDIFHAFDNGILMCKLLLIIDENCIDSRAINTKSTMNAFQIKENIQMGIAACKGLGIKMIGMGTQDFIQKTPHMVLTFVWQALRLCLAKRLNLKDTPEIMRLANEGEELSHLNKLKPEEILIRWINFHLKEAGQERRVANLGKDLKDSKALMYVLNRLDKNKCPLDGITDENDESRAAKMIANSIALGVPDLVTPRDIEACNVKINTIFVANIFNTKHGLEELTEEELNAIGILDDDIDASREERVFRLWINSLNLDGVWIEDLIEECKDGIILCKVVDKIKPGAIDWKRVEQPPKNDFGRNGNCGEALNGCKNKDKGLGLKMIGLGGNDIVKGDRKCVLATCWQICKQHYLAIIGNKTEADLVKWANERVGDKAPPMKDFKDKSALSDGKFLINLCSTIEERYVNWDLLTPGETDEDKCLNAKYGITLARKLEAIVFCVWEDMVNCNAKQNLIMYSTLCDIAETYGKKKE